MKYAIIITAILSIAATAQTATPQLSVEEVFSVETSEELEASLADGYPMPWLAAILEDETIPEEDRYWLDCRVRAVIARDLHLFYSRDGGPIHVEAEGGIRNGESYWREVFIVEPEYPEIRWSQNHHHHIYDPPYYFIRTPGYLCDRFGEKIGDIATTDIRIHLPRNGHSGIYTTGCHQHLNPSRLFFLSSENAVKELVIGPRLDSVSSLFMSEDGSISIAVCEWDGSWTRDRDMGLGIDYSNNDATLHVFSGTGDLLYTKAMPYPPGGSGSPVISPDTRYIGYTTGIGNTVYLLDVKTGETLYEWSLYGSFSSFFTRNSRYLCVTAVGGAKIFDCQTGEIAFEMPDDEILDGEYHQSIGANNDLSVLTGNRKINAVLGEEPLYFHEIFFNGELYRSEPMDVYRNQQVSPNGYFIDIENYSPFIGNLWDGPSVPYTVLTVEGAR